MGIFGGNGEEVIRGIHRVPQIYHREASATDRRLNVGDAQGKSSAGNSENAISDDLNKETAGNCGTMGGVTSTIRSVCNVEGIKRGWTQEGGLVVPRGDIEITPGKLGRNLAGG